MAPPKPVPRRSSTLPLSRRPCHSIYLVSAWGIPGIETNVKSVPIVPMRPRDQSYLKVTVAGRGVSEELTSFLGRPYC